jgi:non-heme chloroperoxidase
MPMLTTSDGVRLHYTDDGKGRPMLFVSGWSMSGEWFVEQRKHFRATRRVVILDTRAHGKSEPVTWGHRLSRHAADLNEAITQLGLGDITLVGWSRGTSVLLSYIELFGTSKVREIALAVSCPASPRAPTGRGGSTCPRRPSSTVSPPTTPRWSAR